MRNHGINKSGEKRRVNQIRHELSPLRNRAAGDSGGGYGEGPLVQEITVVERGIGHLLQAEEMFPDEPVRRPAKGEGEAEEVVEEAAGGGVENVGEHDVHGVLGANRAGAEHGEAELHGEDEVGGEEQVGGVDGVGGVDEFVRDDGELAADVLCGAGGVGGVGAE